MKKIKNIIIFIFIIIILTSCNSEINKNSSYGNPDKLTVAVSIIPQETFVRKVAKDKVNVVVMVPPGSNPENYQPSPKEMTLLSEADIYFSMGVPTDKITILPNIEEYCDGKVVQLDREVSAKYPDRVFSEEELHHHNHQEDKYIHEGRDPHIWLSPKRVIVIVETIAKELSKIDPSNKSFYEENAADYIEELRQLDLYIQEKLNKSEKKTFLIYHPSYGYFADDYGLKMVSIEEDGKDATAKRIQNLIDTAKEEDIRIIFYQEEFSDEQAKTIAKEIGGTAIKVRPLSADYVESLREITDYIASLGV